MNENKNTQDPKPDQPQHSPQGYPPPPYYYPPSYEEDELNLIDLWRVIWDSKWLIISITVLCTGIAVTAALLTTPIYRSEVLMLPVPDENSNGQSSVIGQFGGSATLTGINVGAVSGSKVEAVALLKSRALTEQFIKEGKLLKILFFDKWDAEKERWIVDNSSEIPSMWDAYKVFNNNVRKVSEDIKTGLITLAIEWPDPKLAAEWAGKLLKLVNKNMRERAVHEAERNLVYLKKALTKTSSMEVQEAIYRIIEGQIKTVMLAKSREEYSFKVVDPPVVPEQKIKPKRTIMVMLGFVAGFFLGVFIAFTRNFVKQKFQVETDTSTLSPS